MPPRVERFIAALQAIRDQSPASDPDWTDRNSSDPGITLVELLAFVADQIGARTDELPVDARAELLRIGLRLSQLFGGGQPGSIPPYPGDSGSSAGRLERSRFFEGQMLTAAVFETEQNYVRAKLRRLQRACLSPGIVSGLEVELSGGTTQPAVVVKPGLALDPQGELIEVGAAMTCSLPAPSSGQRFVLLRYVERDTTFELVLAGSGESTTEAGRVEEGFAISVEAQADAAAVPLARLVPRGKRWRIVGQ